MEKCCIKGGKCRKFLGNYTRRINYVYSVRIRIYWTLKCKFTWIYVHILRSTYTYIYLYVHITTYTYIYAYVHITTYTYIYLYVYHGSSHFICCFLPCAKIYPFILQKDTVFLGFLADFWLHDNSHQENIRL